MQFQKLSDEQKKIRRWRMQRNRLVQKLLEEDNRLLRIEAVRRATKMMRKKGN